MAWVSDGAYTVAPVPGGDLKIRYMRQLVDDPTGQPAGTVVVDPKNRFLYLVQEGGKALRYGVGVGKEGMAWSGTANVAMKREWPRWTPTKDMIAREPDKYVKWARGMEGGTQNPLGARALYLFKNGKDTLYRIHGTNEPWSIGQAMSSGCIRMMNQDVIDPLPTRAVGSQGRGASGGRCRDRGIRRMNFDRRATSTKAGTPQGAGIPLLRRCRVPPSRRRQATSPSWGDAPTQRTEGL